MSRTFRRKKGKDDSFLYEWDFSGTYYKKVPLTGKARKKAINKYHSDHGWFWDGHWFVKRIIKRQDRIRAKQALRNCKDYDELIMPVVKKRVIWESY